MPSLARRTLTRLGVVVLGGSLAALAAGGLALTGPAPAAAANQTIQITDSAFGTAVLTVQVGDTVTWTNADDRPHTVTSQDGAFDSGNLDEGGTFSYTFTAAGTYAYLCEYHPDMRATIVVQAASAANPQPSSPATGGNTTSAPSQHTSHDAGAGSDQPNTAVALPTRQIPGASYLLWGAALLLLAIAFLPSLARRLAPAATRPPGGWRR
jgi:plastocyanin